MREQPAAHFGQYNDLAPKVAPTQGERIPQHLTVQLARPANVAVFLVVPGRGSTLLFPADSTQSMFVEAGSHLVETSLARAALTADSSRLIRRPAEPNRAIGSRAADVAQVASDATRCRHSVSISTATC